MNATDQTGIRPRCVAIVGGSGSGKSWLAARLQAELGRAAAILSLDDFYRDLGHLSGPERDRVNFDDPVAIDWITVRGVMDGLREGMDVTIPAYDFTTHTRRPAGHPATPARFLLMEGLWLLHHSWMRPLFDFSVFVDCPDGERMRRRIERDVATRGRTAESVRSQYENHVRPMHDRFVAPQRDKADRVVGSPVPDSDFPELLSAVRGNPISAGGPINTI